MFYLLFNNIYLKDFKKEVEVAAEMAGIELEDANYLVDRYFKALSYIINDERMPIVRVTSLGTLKFDEKKVNNILKDIKAIKIKPETKKFYETKLEHVSKRVKKEGLGKGKEREKGLGFWWSFVPKDFVTQLIKKEKDGEEGEQGDL